MKGLIWKDFLILRKSMRTYLLLMLFYAALSLTGSSSTVFVSMLVVMMMILPISAFAYDEHARWDRYALCLPLGRDRVVQARYGFVLFASLLAAALGGALSLVLSMAAGESPALYLCVLLASLDMGFLCCAILLPLCYKLGVERARPYLMLVALVPVVGLFCASKLGILDLSSLDRLTPAQVTGMLSIGLAATLIGLGLSCRVSCRIVAAKDY